MVNILADFSCSRADSTRGIGLGITHRYTVQTLVIYTVHGFKPQLFFFTKKKLAGAGDVETHPPGGTVPGTSAVIWPMWR